MLLLLVLSNAKFINRSKSERQKLSSKKSINVGGRLSIINSDLFSIKIDAMSLLSIREQL